MKKMDFSKIKESPVYNFLYHKRMYILSFFIPVIVLFGVFAAFGYYPFGDFSVLALDLNGQYICYYEHLRDAFWGDASYLYSWSRNLGGEMLGLYGYYLASPFMIIICLLPRSCILISVMIMQLAKIGSYGVAFTYYLKKSKNINSYTTVVFSSMYALMSYSVVQLMDPMWLDGLIYLPLVTYGIELLINKGKKINFIIPLALMFIAHFYIGWMIAIYSVLYFFIYVLFVYDSDEYGAGFKRFMMTCVRFGISALTAGAIAAFILIPVYYSLKLGKFEFSTPNWSLREQFVIADFFTKLLPDSYDTVRNEGLPFIYCGALSLFMVPLFFMNSNVDGKKKLGGGIMLILMFICMYLSTIDLVWHGFQIPNWLPYRYSFIFSFIMLAMAAEAFEHIEGVTFKNIGVIGVVLAAYIIIIDKQEPAHIDYQAVWLGLACVAGYVMLLFYHKKNAETSKTTALIVLVLVVGELFASSIQTLKDVHSDVVISKYSSYVPVIEKGRAVTAKLEEYDTGFYRTEKTFHRSVNDPIAYGFNGVSHSSSTINSGVINMMDNLGYASRGHYVKYSGATKLTDDIFGIRYVMTKEDEVPYTKEVLSYDDITVYENEDALSVGYLADKGILDLVIDKDRPFDNQNELMNTLLGTEDTEYFKEIDIDTYYTENVSLGTSYSHQHYTVITEGANAQVEYILTAPSDDPIYMYLPCDYSGYEKKLNVWVNKEFVGNFYETDNYCIMRLGEFERGQEISVILTLTANELYMKDQWFFYLDEDVLERGVARLAEHQLEITDHGNDYLIGTINVENAENKLLFTTIPYEPGWNIEVDGEKVEYQKAAGGLIAFEVPDGTHEVSMKYFPKSLLVGIFVSLAGVAALIVICVLENKKNRILLERLYK